jgi:hypothetical protein
LRGWDAREAEADRPGRCVARDAKNAAGSSPADGPGLVERAAWDAVTSILPFAACRFGDGEPGAGKQFAGTEVA